jgi:hypothetical protein
MFPESIFSDALKHRKADIALFSDILPNDFLRTITHILYYNS